MAYDDGMATSQNGWPVITDRSKIDNGPINGHVYPNGFLAGDVQDAFTWLFTQMNARVESVAEGNPPDEWGWYVKKISGSNTNTYSNHASGTAGDYNASQHPMGTRNTYSASQRAEIHSILTQAHGIFRWGGDYTGRPDDMHFEIVATPAKVHEFVTSLKGLPMYKYETVPAGIGFPILNEGDDDAKHGGYNGVGRAQALLNYLGAGLKVDGVYGPATSKAVARFYGGTGKRLDQNEWVQLAGLARAV